MKEFRNNYNFDYDYPPIAWWLHLGTAIRGNVLVCADLGIGGLQYLSVLCDKVFVICDMKLQFDRFPNINKINRQTIGSYKYSAVIIDKYNSCCDFSPEDIKSIFGCNLTEDASICLYEDNQYSISKNRTSVFLKMLNVFYDFRYAYYKSLLRPNYLKQFPSITYDVVPYESFREGHYETNKNIFKLKEKIKSFLLNTKISRLLSNSTIWIASNGRYNTGIVELILPELKKRCYLADYKSISYSIIYYKTGKLLFAVDAKGEKSKKYIVVIATDRPSVGQRMAEMKTIQHLNNISDVKELVLDEYYHEDIYGFNCFIMEAYDGITVDIKTDKMQEMTTHAYQTLLKLTKATLVRDYNISERNKVTLQYFDKMFKRLPGYSDEITILKNYVVNKLDDIDNLTVCMHGDFKLENCMLDSKNNVIGLIDWELSEITGLPLLDLYYLIIYNYQVRDDADDFAEVFSRLLDNNLLPYEVDMLKEYYDLTSLRHEDTLFYQVLFFVHHYACRFVYGVDYTYMKFFESALSSLVMATKKESV